MEQLVQRDNLKGIALVKQSVDVAIGVGQCERRGALSTMSILFEPVKVNHMELPNRFVRSATCDGCAEKSRRVSNQEIEIYSEHTVGGAG